MLIFLFFSQTSVKDHQLCKIVDFAVSADHRINLKECEKKDKYLELARELKKPWNMKVTIVTIAIGAFGTITKRILKGLEDLEVGGWVEIIQMTALLVTARILRRVLETWETCCHSNSSEKPSTYTDVKNCKGEKTDYLISAKRPDLIIINKKKKKRICKIVEFAVPADHRIKLKEPEKIYKYLDLAR